MPNKPGWEMYKKILTSATGFSLEKNGLGKNDFHFYADAGDCPLVFNFLGAGTNKIAIKISDEWVLLLGKTGRGVELASFREEVNTLIKIAKKGVPVPEPFKTLSNSDSVNANSIIFHLIFYYDGDENKVPAFIQSYMPKEDYLEMNKTTKEGRNNFFKNEVLKDELIKTETLRNTFHDLEKINIAFRSTPWGDFQVQYQRKTGNLIVFDPLEKDPNQKDYQKSLDCWKKDLLADKRCEFLQKKIPSPNSLDLLPPTRNIPTEKLLPFYHTGWYSHKVADLDFPTHTHISIGLLTRSELEDLKKTTSLPDFLNKVSNLTTPNMGSATLPRGKFKKK